jgi:hypothetical protein
MRFPDFQSTADKIYTVQLVAMKKWFSRGGRHRSIWHGHMPVPMAQASCRKVALRSVNGGLDVEEIGLIAAGQSAQTH